MAEAGPRGLATIMPRNGKDWVTRSDWATK